MILMNNLQQNIRDLLEKLFNNKNSSKLMNNINNIKIGQDIYKKPCMIDFMILSNNLHENVIGLRKNGLITKIHQSK